jgi:hypothetical protein
MLGAAPRVDARDGGAAVLGACGLVARELKAVGWLQARLGHRFLN